MYIRFLFGCFFLFPILTIGSDIFFLKNKGQLETGVIGKSDVIGGALFLETDGITYNFIETRSHTSFHIDSMKTIKYHAFQYRFYKSLTPKIKFQNTIPGKINYFTKKNVTNLNRFQEVTYQNVYRKIDYKIYTYGDALKYDWIIHPNGNPNKIQIQLEGVDNITLINGRLHIKTSLNEIIEETPYAYQIVDGQKVQVSCEFVFKNNRIAFNFPNGYDRSKSLVIDPVLIFSSYSGSYANNFGYTATYDEYGFLYSGGTAFNIGYPTTLGAYSESYNGGVGGTDIVLSKYDTTGTFLIFSSYLGGSSDEVPHSLIVYENELFMMGTTGSNDFPTTAGCFDNSFNGGTPISAQGVGINYNSGCDIVISRFSNDGSELISSTYIGGSMNDGFNTSNDLRYNYGDEIRGEIDFDSQGNCYIASSTQSNNFPIVNSLVQPLLKGSQDGILFKINKDLSNLEWSTFLGGSNNDAIYSLSFDSEDHVFVSGGTKSINFPTTSNAYQPNYIGGISDAFITHFNSDGSEILHSTFFGSAEYDQAYFIEIDNMDAVYIYGQTLAQGTALIHNANFAQPNSGQFIAKLHQDLSNIGFSTVFGSGSNSIDISPTAFLVDVCNRIYCSGWGGATNALHGGPGGHTGDLITTQNAFQQDTDSSDFYLLIIEENASMLSYATFFGGESSSEHVDGGTSRFDKRGIVYQSVCAGCGGFSDFPTTADAVSETNNSSCNNAVFKFDPEFPLTIANFLAPDITCSNTVSFSNLSFGNNNYLWDFGDGNTSNLKHPNHTYSNSGIYEVVLYTDDTSSCNLSDSITKVIEIRENENQRLDSLLICQGEIAMLSFPLKESFNYTLFPQSNFDPNINNTLIEPLDSVDYFLIGTYKNCIDTIFQHVSVYNFQFETDPEHEICGDPIWLRIASEDTIDVFWSTSLEFSKPILDSILVTKPGNYYVKGVSFGCELIDTVKVVLSEDCCVEKDFKIPNAFSPNGDNINDRYMIEEAESGSQIIESIELKIFNRWGEKVFETTDITEGWDGSFKGKKLNTDVFDFYLNINCISEKRFFKKGNITLIL